MKITMRKYSEENDYKLMLELLKDNHKENDTQHYNNVNLFEYQCALNRGKDNKNRNLDEVMKSYNLFFDNNTLVGFSENESFYIAKGYESLFNIVIEATENDNPETNTDLEWEIYEGDVIYEKILLKNSYRKTDEYWTRWELNTLESVNHTEITLPKGFKFEYANNIIEQDRIYEAYRFCYGIRFSKSIIDNFSETPTYRKELDLVILKEGVGVVALCSGRFDIDNKLATIEAVSCFHDYRKIGLSMALQNKFIQNAKILGVEKITVYTAMTEKYPAPNRLYEKAGFLLAGNLNVWKKT